MTLGAQEMLWSIFFHYLKRQESRDGRTALHKELWRRRTGKDIFFNVHDRRVAKLLSLIPKITMPPAKCMPTSTKVQLLSPLFFLHMLKDFGLLGGNYVR